MQATMAVLERAAERESVIVDKAKVYLGTERTCRSARAELIAAFIAEGKKTVTVGNTVLVYCPEDERKVKVEDESEALWFMGRVER